MNTKPDDHTNSQQDGAYQVLARKYRPQNFDDLIGHEAMVKTLRNAFSSNRIAHAYVLTGVRGVGKTTTARILARALNYVDADGNDHGPQIDMQAEGLHCRAIAESRHPDVLEMDAASRTGVADIRELIEGVRYAPIEARYKVYIIDEVHMLSTQAFNAILKTLEEPPPHVKFIFATTEIRKLPVTVLSRCQRFDLRRIEPQTLCDHLGNIAEKEGVKVAEEGLAMIAHAAEGSVRDALSILDQAIVQQSQGETADISADDVRNMLGLADRGQIWQLLDHLFKGEIKDALEGFRYQYDGGADPVVILRDLIELTHLITRIKAAGPSAASHGPAGEADAERANNMADQLPMNALTRAWSLLMKGLQETQQAPDPLAAGEMALIRLAFAADLPTPDEALKMLRGDATGLTHGGKAPAASNTPGPTAYNNSAQHNTDTYQARSSAAAVTAPQAAHIAQATAQAHPQAHAQTQAPRLQINSFADIAKLAGAHKDAKMRAELESYVHIISFQRGKIEMRLDARAPSDLPGRLMRALFDWTGERWLVSLNANAAGAPALRDARTAEVMDHPLVKQALNLFPKAEVTSIKDTNPFEFVVDTGNDQETTDNGEEDADDD